MSIKLKALPLAITQVIATGALSALAVSPAMAQQAPAAAVEPAVQSVTVTGTMIKRVDAESAEAITTLSAEKLKDLGITSVEAALNMLTMNNATFTTASNVASFGGGNSYANLRGLGAGKTLVLLDGQRLANNSSTGASVDLNTIPFAAIERIEVLREGASSTYGSDAIAGVINFITKKDLQGGEVNVNYSKPTTSGGNSDSFDIAWGKGSLAEDGYNFMVTASVAHQKELKAAQRSFSRTGYNPANNLQNLNGSSAPAPGSYSDDGVNLWQVGYPGCGGNKNVVAVGGSCQFLYSAVVDLIPQSTNDSALIQFTKRLPDNNQLSVQYFYSKFDLTTWGGPQSYFFNMNPTSAFYPTAANSSCVGTCSTPAPTLGGQLAVGWTDPGNNRYFGNVNKEQRLLLTFSGNNLGWDYSTSADLSRNHGQQLVRGGEANYNVLAPGGNLNDNINPFGPSNAAGQTVINSAYLNGDINDSTLNLYSLNGSASHALGDAFGAGRESQIAFGFDLRNENLTSTPTPLTSILHNATYYPAETIKGSRSSEAIYSEVNIPITKKFEVTLSERYDRFTDFGQTTNGKLSFAYAPLDILKIRGAASTGFRAPSLVDEYAPQILGAGNSFNIANACINGQYTAIFSSTNCSNQSLTVSGGNPNLKPETSQNYDLGFILSPTKSLDLTVDYYRVVVRSQIGGIPELAIFNDPVGFANLYNLNSAGTLSAAATANIQCPTVAAPTCGYIIQTKQNTGFIATNGLDLSANYVMKTSYGKFHFGMEGTYVMGASDQLYTGGPTLNIAGRFNQGVEPTIRWQDILSVDWTNQQFGAGLNNHYTSKYQDEVPNAAGNQINVAAYSIWNGYVSYKPMTGLKVLLGINNLFNTNPPFSNQSNNWQAGYNPLTANPLGRTVYLNGTYNF